MCVVEAPADEAVPGHAPGVPARHPAGAHPAAPVGEPAAGAVRRPPGRPARLEDGPADQRAPRGGVPKQLRRGRDDECVLSCARTVVGM